MNIFNRKTKKKHIEQFELKIAKLLEADFPQLKKVIEISKLYGISFANNPDSIYISRGYSPEIYNEIQKNHRTHFNLKGVSVFNVKRQQFEPLKLNYSFDSLTRIEVDKPEQFHKVFDLHNLKVGKIEVEELPMENPDKEAAEKILKSLTKEQFELLELEDTFEIEFDEKLYYTILDMEDGNYVAIDKSGKIYRLNHDHSERIKKIANNPTDFFKIYKGQKSDLVELMYE